MKFDLSTFFLFNPLGFWYSLAYFQWLYNLRESWNNTAREGEGYIPNNR